jgi:hypothetical protein
VLMQWVELHQLGSMVGTQGTPKKECGQHNREEFFCSYVEHKEGFHHMYMDA